VALSFFAFGLVGHSCLELAARTFFAMQDTITPLLVAAGIGVLYVMISLLLMRIMGHGGLALANSIAITLEVVLLLWLLRTRIGSVEGRETLRATGLIGIACVVMALTILMVQRLLDSPTSTAEQIVYLAATVSAGAVAYGAAGWWLRIEAIRQIPQMSGMVASKKTPE
jgi:putative peptidoglycan lipid II flippase